MKSTHGWRWNLVLRGLALGLTFAWALTPCPAFALDPGNISYLSDREFRGLEADLNAEIMTETHARAYRQQFQDMTRDYEFRKKYDLNSRNDELQHQAALNRFSMGAAKDVQNQKVKATLKQVQRKAEQLEDLEFARAPIAAAVFAASLYTGRTMNLKLSDDARLSYRAALKDRVTSLNLTSSVCNGGVVVDARGQDRASFSLGRSIPWLDLNSNFSYGANTHSLNASLSRGLFIDGLSASLGSRRSFEDRSVSEATLGLHYGVSF